MVNIQRSTIIDAPIETVWTQIRDFNNHALWHPAVATSTIDDHHAADKIGAVRNFRLQSGERLREQLLYLSDKDHTFSYTIVESEEIPLFDYIAHVKLKPVTDGQRTFWSWRSRFNTPPGQEQQLAELVAVHVYESGFKAIKQCVARTQPYSASETPALALPRQYATKTTRAAQAENTAITGTGMVIDRYGGPEVLQPAEINAPAPQANEVRIRQTAIGVNYIDVYCRSGFFKMLQPPGIPGMEAAGIVIDTGHSVQHLHTDDRVAYACPPVGAYASVRTLDADLVVKLPDHLDDQHAAASLLKGMTAAFLLFEVHPLKSGESVLVFAPAGGVGRLLCQWAAHLDARVIGASSSSEKASAARLAGAEEVILPGEHSLEDQVMQLTNGRGVDVIFDAVGRDTFMHSLNALAPCGHLNQLRPSIRPYRSAQYRYFGNPIHHCIKAQLHALHRYPRKN